MPSSVFQKLKLDDSKSLLVINAPEAFKKLLHDLTYDTEIQASKQGKYDFVMIFAEEQAELEKLCVANAKAGKFDCSFWVCYPKGTGAIKSDIKRDTVWKTMEGIQHRPVSQIAIDDTWSALRARPLSLYESKS